MNLLTPDEVAYLEVFLYEATTPPFTGPATNALHAIGVEYADVSFLSWAFEEAVPRTSHVLGRPAAVSPPLPCPDRQAVLRRNQEIRGLWEQREARVGA